jgi:hypothetical protein
MMKRAFAGLLSLCMAGSIAACVDTSRQRSSGGSGPAQMHKLESVALRLSRQVIGVGETANAELFARYDNGSSALVSAAIQWSSSDAAIVSVDESGVVTAVAMGEAVLTGTYGEKSAQSALVVVAMGDSLVAILIAPDNAQVEAGKTIGLSAKGVFGSATQYDISQSVLWSSSDENVFIVDALGLAKGVSAGVATIHAELSGVQASTGLTVIPPKVLSALEITSVSTSVTLNETVQLLATAKYNDSTTRDVSAEVVWTSGSPEVASIDTAGRVTGVSVGQAVITANFEDKSANITMTAVDGPSVVRLIIDPTALEMSIGDTRQINVIADFSDESRVNVTSMATWMSSDASVVSVSTSGMAEAVSAGQALITVSFRGQQATLSAASSACRYPQAASSIRNNAVIPELGWTNAIDETGARVNFSTHDFFCDAANEQYTSLHFMITAGWCPYCPDYLRSVDAQAAQIEAAGGKLIYVEVETERRQPATSADAEILLNSIINNGRGLRVGDGETMPTPMSFGRAVNAYPSMFVVRRSDMMVVSDSTGQSHLSLAQQIANGGGTTMPPMPNCGASDEESYEPNDDENSPATLMAGANFSGGICTPDNQDWYFVDYMGDWTFDLTFTHATADLDVYAWNMGSVDLQNPAAGSDSTDDNEQLMFSGPGVVVVIGYQGGTAPYQVSVTGN